MRILSFLLLLLALPACSTVESHEESVTAQTSSGEVIISNDTSQRVFYFVVGRKVAARINWTQHLDTEHSVAPGDERSIDLDEIVQSEEGEDEALAHWWHAAPGDSSEVPGPVEYIVVEL